MRIFEKMLKRSLEPVSKFAYRLTVSLNIKAMYLNGVVDG